MANLNLSQFGEKLFVADADHTFIWDSAASISKRVSRNSWLNSGTLTSDAPVTISQTWADSGQTFKALVVNAAGTSGTNSASGSLLLDLQVGGVSKFYVNKAGDINTVTGVNCVSLSGTTGFFGGSVRLNNNAAFLAFGSPSSVVLQRDGADNTLALRNGGNAQTFNVYGTWSTAITNFERLAIKYNDTDVAYQIAAEKGTTNGDYRPLQLWTGGASRLHVTTAGNVGIGTTAPRYRFSNTNVVLSDYSSIEPSTTSGFGWMASEANKYASNFANNTSGGYGMSIYANSNGTQKLLTLSNNSADVVNFLANGNVGIGTTAPIGVLDVRGANTIATGVQIGQTSAGVGNFITLHGSATSGGTSQIIGNYNSTEGPLILGTFTNRANQLCLAVNGNVGIGTTSPSSKLHVSAGDVEVDTIAKGVILKSPDSTRYRVTVANGGTLSVAAV